MRALRSQLKFANVISVVALCIALGGTSYAALSLPRNSVTSKQLKPGSVTSSDVKNRSLLRKDFKRGQLPRGAAGPVGPAGVAGPAGPAGPAGASGANGTNGADGTARAYARVNSNGDIVAVEGTGGAPQAKGITNENIVHTGGAPVADNGGTPADETTTGDGVYCFGGLGFTPTSAVVATDNTDSMPPFPAMTGGELNFITTAAINKGPDFGRCPRDFEQVRVAITRVDQTNAPTLANHGFFIWLEG